MLDKPRPIVLLNRNVVINKLTSWLVAPCTTRTRGLPTEVALSTTDGLDRPCVVSADNITLVDRELVGSLITTLGTERLQQICQALAVAVGCEAVG